MNDENPRAFTKDDPFFFRVVEVLDNRGLTVFLSFVCFLFVSVILSMTLLCYLVDKFGLAEFAGVLMLAFFVYGVYNFIMAIIQIRGEDKNDSV